MSKELSAHLDNIRISTPSHHEWLYKLPTSFAHTIYMYTILILFLESMLLLIEYTVGIKYGRNRSRLIDLLIHLMSESTVPDELGD